jgi:hypothetical protein
MTENWCQSARLKLRFNSVSSFCMSTQDVGFENNHSFIIAQSDHCLQAPGLSGSALQCAAGASDHSAEQLLNERAATVSCS